MLILALRRTGTRADLLPRLEARILRASRNGRFGTTFATAMVVTALSGLREVPGAREPFVVEIEQGEVRSRVTVRPDQRDSIKVALPRAANVVVTAPAGRELLVVLRGRSPLRCDHARDAGTRIVVSRSLVDPETGRDVRGFLAAGQTMHMRITLAAQAAQGYLAVECPIPAGFEVDEAAPVAAKGWEVQDDRAVFAFQHLVPGVTTIDLPLVAGFAGDLAWPAATAVAMYEDRHCGHCEPDRIIVLAH